MRQGRVDTTRPAQLRYKFVIPGCVQIIAAFAYDVLAPTPDDGVRVSVLKDDLRCGLVVVVGAFEAMVTL